MTESRQAVPSDIDATTYTDAAVEDLPEAAEVVGRETVAFDDGTAAIEAAVDGDADA